MSPVKYYSSQIPALVTFLTSYTYMGLSASHTLLLQHSEVQLFLSLPYFTEHGIWSQVGLGLISSSIIFDCVIQLFNLSGASVLPYVK